VKELLWRVMVVILIHEHEIREDETWDSGKGISNPFTQPRRQPCAKGHVVIPRGCRGWWLQIGNHASIAAMKSYRFCYSPPSWLSEYS
jgi:hypothetical protein